MKDLTPLSFSLKQVLQVYRHYQEMIRDCDREIESHLNDFASRVDPQKNPPPPASKPGNAKRNQPSFDLRTHLYRIIGTDLTQINGINISTIQVYLSEVGVDLSKFPSADHFSSWLNLSPNNKITGGKVLSSRTQPGANRLALALRLAANSLYHSQSYLGNYFRRMRAKHGAPKAITATAHKIARIIYHLVKTGKQFDESIFAEQEKIYQKRFEHRLRSQAKSLGYQLVPITNPI